MNVRAAIGRHGEELAAGHLSRHGYRILERNWRCARGELDIIAQLPGLVVVVEVKTRRSLRFGHPLESITDEKALRLRRLAKEWMRATSTRARLRIDAIGIVLSDDGVSRFDHVKAIA